MAISAQDKILYVANKLGLSTLKDMQGSTGAVYDTDVNDQGVLFKNAASHGNPGFTNLNDNRFEVNEALLIETVAFFGVTGNELGVSMEPLYRAIGSCNVVVWELVIGNKTVLKDMPVWSAGQPSTFASTAITIITSAGDQTLQYNPRTQVYMEGAGILIPPQVDFQLNYKIYNTITGAISAPNSTYHVGAYLFGTKVNLNFNTSL